MTLEQFSLEGKVAVVTGASRGIGRAIAVGFAGAGADVAVASRTESDLRAVADEIEAMGRHALVVPTDVSQAEEVDRMVEMVLEEFEGVDVLSHNAGISTIFKRSEDVTEEEWDRIIDVNLKGTFLCCRAVGRAMIRAERGGAIVNMSSIGGKVGLYHLLVYCAAKGGIEQLTRVLAADWARHGIRVNALAPGYVATDLTQGMRESDYWHDVLLDRTPLSRFAEPEEIVGAAIYLASDASRFVTGETLYLDGGWTAT